MSGMYMSEWPMFGTKDPNLGSSTDLLFDRDFIFGAFATCLIQGGYPVGATFERTGDILRDGVTFGEDTPVVQGGKYWHNGQFTNLAETNSDNWQKSGATVVGDLVTLQPLGFIRLSNAIPNPSGPATGEATLSDLIGEVRLRIFDGVVSTDKDILEDCHCHLTVIEDAGATTTQFFVRNDSGTVASFNISDILTTHVAYPVYPLSIPTLSGAPASIDTAASAPNPDKHGLNWEDTEDKNSWAFDLLGVAGVGTITTKGLNIVPSVTEWQTTGDFNILSGATGNQILYIESGTGLICATDGANTCKSNTAYTEGTDHLVSLVFGDGNMQIIMDGTKGGLAPFVGTFTPGETLKWGLNNEDIFSKGDVCGSTTATFGEAVELAQELAFTL